MREILPYSIVHLKIEPTLSSNLCGLNSEAPLYKSVLYPCTGIFISVCQYHVEVYTGDRDNAGTDAAVYLQIFGERGDTGIRQLLQPKHPGDKFESGRVWVISVVHVISLENF